MQIQRTDPTPPPPEFMMVFTYEEGLTLLGALREWNDRHNSAFHISKWKSWEAELDRLLHRRR